MKENNYIVTHSGIKFNPFTATVDDILIEDIAHALSHVCRFAGHCDRFYSVGQHSMIVSDNCPDKYKLWGLLHDATEAYLCDIPRPFKRMKGFDFYNELEDSLMAVIAKKFGLDGISVPPIVKQHDVKALFTEKRDLISNNVSWEWENEPDVYENKIIPLPSFSVKIMFLDKFDKLTRI